MRGWPCCPEKREPGLTEVAEAKVKLLPLLPQDLFPGGDKGRWGWLKAAQVGPRGPKGGNRARTREPSEASPGEISLRRFRRARRSGSGRAEDDREQHRQERNRIIGTVSFGGRAAARFSASFYAHGRGFRKPERAARGRRACP